MKRLLFFALILGLVACGKQGPPRPPVPTRPAAGTDLLVAQRGPTMVLTWSYPALTSAGETLDRVDRILVYRLREELPEDLEDRTAVEVDLATGSEKPRAMELFDRVPPVSPQRFLVLAEKVGEISREQIPSFVAGATVVVEDRPQLESESGRPFRYTYGVTAVRGRIESELSNLVSIVPIDVPLPPDSLTIESEPEAVVLRWSAPVRTVLGGDAPSIEGYNLYRLPQTGGTTLTATPINDQPIEQTEFRDTPPYGTWRYAVTTVRHDGPPSHESQFSLLRPVTFEDLLPPPVPTDVSALVEDRIIRIIWTGVDTADLAGYHVYRHVPLAGREREQLTTEPITRTSFADETPEPGLGYHYAVASVDRSGNVSELAVTEQVMIPR